MYTARRVKTLMLIMASCRHARQNHTLPCWHQAQCVRHAKHKTCKCILMINCLQVRGRMSNTRTRAGARARAHTHTQGQLCMIPGKWHHLALALEATLIAAQSTLSIMLANLQVRQEKPDGDVSAKLDQASSIGASSMSNCSTRPYQASTHMTSLHDYPSQLLAPFISGITIHVFGQPLWG